jgi:hypothetical protein
MRAEAWIAVGPFLGMGVNVLVQVALLRASGSARFLLSLLGGFIAGALALVAILGAAAAQGVGPRDLAGYALLTAGAYAGLGFCYFAFLNLNQASLRIRMLKELDAAPGATLPLADLLERYHAGHILDARLERLVAGGQLVERDGRYLRGPRSEFLLLSRVLNLLKRGLLGGRRPPPCP